MKRQVWGIAAALAVSGCATTIMGGYVGKPVENVMVRYGPPANVFDMPDGRRAFQWQINSNVALPGYANTYTQANIYAPPGAFAHVSGQTQTTYMPAQNLSMSCLYTMYGRYEGGTWTLVGYEKPSLACY